MNPSSSYTPAEILFDGLGARYETAYSSSPNFLTFLSSVITTLPPHSRVLDIGCGTGVPVSSMIASAGHNVHGLDVSGEMVKLARARVKSGTFEKADMRSWSPAGAETGFDAAFVVFSLYQVSPAETMKLCYRFGEWIAPGGVLVVGTTPSGWLPSLEDETDNNSEGNNGLYVEDPTYNAVRHVGKRWMGSRTIETFFSEETWRGMLAGAGFEVEREEYYDFEPQDASHRVTERHHFFVARRKAGVPLLGPYPLPMGLTGLSEVARPVRGFLDRVVSAELDGLRLSGTVLCMGGESRFTGPNIQSFSEFPFETLPFAPNTFTITICPHVLDSTPDVPKAISELVRVTARTPESQMIFLQAAPDNEVVQLLNANVQHQGLLLATAMEELRAQGFEVLNLKRVRAWYEFSEVDGSDRCRVAAETLSGLYQGGRREDDNDMEELRRRLALYFLDETTTVGYDMVMLTTRASA
ncbi:S-adenosyl-L-methionine-dependent methyltransferase [Aspergillus karnatakaensis]|uniref:uncharacterized protein n=1 Tax=Aspergillus karnatakaensis TaxID=1810916 RepID=UPI003CCDB241